MALPNVPEEREYGAVKEQEQIEVMAPAPIEATPTQADEASMDAAMEVVAQSAPVAQPEQQAAPEQQQPNMWRIPQNYAGVLGTQVKPLNERFEDYGRLWSILASDPNVDPTVRNLASLLSRGE